MRGAEGVERSLTVGQFWDAIHKEDLLYRMARVFQSLATSTFRIRPTFYSRFTFTVNRVLTVLVAGSPKIFTGGRTKVQAWFYASGLSYTLHGAIHHAENAIDAIDSTIREARRNEFDEDHPDAQFFLEFVTCRAYVVQS